MIKANILQHLRSSDQPVSGEQLRARLDVSRVSVWKHIKALIEAGYEIESGPKGYRLVHSPDIPYAWELSDFDHPVHYFEEVPSTMDIARKMARAGAPHLSLVIAGGQLRGRGRLGRQWLSDHGGLYMTAILRPALPLMEAHKASFAFSVEMTTALRNLFSIDARVKWPNDILIGDRKLAGMLAEMEAEADLLSFINIGMGVNIHNQPADDSIPAVSLKKLVGERASCLKLLRTFLPALAERLTPDGLKAAVADWKKLCNTIGRRVTVETTHETICGTAKDINENGALVVQLSDGTCVPVVYGDCFHNDSKNTQSKD